MRQLQLNLRLNDEEAKRITTLARHYGITAADLVRMLVKREFDAIRRRPRSRGDLPP